MLKKKCEHCGKDFEAQRSDAKFCSSTCRASFWQTKNLKTQSIEEFKSSFKGLVNDSITAEKSIITKTIDNPAFQDMLSKIKLKEKEFKRMETEEETLKSQFDEIQKEGIGTSKILTTGAGVAFGLANSYSNVETLPKRFGKTILGGVLGLGAGIVIDNVSEKIRKEQYNNKLTEINAKLKRKYLLKTLIYNEHQQLIKDISKVVRFITVDEEIIEKPFRPLIETNVIKRVMEENKQIVNVTGQKSTAFSKKPFAPTTNNKIISSTQLSQMDYDALGFDGRWLNLLGQPSTNFHCAVHGMSGEGKSTFSIQFANYLAENFGKVLFVSGEEGFSKTMKDKLNNNNASSENLYFADLRFYQEFINEVKPNEYNFIIIDSLDNMRIGAQDLKEIRTLHVNSGIITISQSTKDGKMRGSYEIIHDSDIAIRVSNGVAETIKNRFLEKGRLFEIFEKQHPLEMLRRNTVRG